jgi:hypothetical protein
LGDERRERRKAGTTEGVNNGKRERLESFYLGPIQNPGLMQVVPKLDCFCHPPPPPEKRRALSSFVLGKKT